jgi:molybdenum cofactor synthesis domain-containing protein
MQKKIELISIGTELLSGRTLNSHAQTLGAALSGLGLTLSRDTTVPDESETIQAAVKEALERTDVVVVSGGLGPTVDDITRAALADLFSRNIVLSQPALAALRTRCAARGFTVTSASERMALILEGAETLINRAGAAAAQRLDFPDLGKVLFIVPGPPGEFAAVLNDHIVPWLRKTFPDAVPAALRILTAQGIGESDLVTRLETAAFQCPEISIGFYPGFGKVEIRLSAPPEKTALLDKTERILRGLLHGHLIE